MRISLVTAMTTLACMCLVPATAAAQQSAKSPRQYYLALGDSLARGAQPNSSGTTVPTNKGYANDLMASEKSHFKGLTLKELGCLDESTTTMIKGGICKYSKGSQLKQALAFLHQHKGHIAFVTIDIGANDIDNCVSGGVVDLACVAKGVKHIQKNIPKIAAALRKAVGNKVPIIGMTYYDPFLAAWLQGPSGQVLAGQSQALAKSVNTDIIKAYKPSRVKIANVAIAFKTYTPLSKTTTFHHQQVPVAVVQVCKLTWMCAPSPRGPNIHATVKGYKLIETVFAKDL